MADELDVVARRLVAKSELDDATFTDAFKLIVEAAGGVLVGLDNRIKTVESLTRKLDDMLALDPGLTLPQAADRIYDVLRFTVVADPEQYAAVRAAVLAALDGRGGPSSRNATAGQGLATEASMSVCVLGPPSDSRSSSTPGTATRR